MKSSLLTLAAGLLFALPFAAHAKIERVVEKTFAVQPGATLKVETQGGDITVRPGTDDEVRIVARQTIRAKSEAEADALLEKLELVFNQEGAEVRVSAKYPTRGAGFGSWPPVSMDFEITVPTAINLVLRTSGGDVRVGDLTGRVDVRTSGGDVKLGRIDGTVQAGTSGGDVDLVQATGAADLHTSGGDIEIETVINMVKAATSGGDVSASFVGPLKGDCSLSTSGGDVEVKVAADAVFQLDASTGGGKIKAKGLALTIERGGVGQSRLGGKVNGGGPLLKLRTSGGDIEIESAISGAR
jgi:DUF4097 and DUF4098 domain-containing protein YvlB